MTIRHILVPLFGYDGDRVSLDAALAIAKRHDAHVAALHVETDPLEQTPLMVDVGVAITELVEAAERHATQRAKAAAAVFEEWQQASGTRVDGEASLRPGVSTAFTNIKGNEEDLLARFGRLTDLVVLARPQKNQAADLIAVRIEDVLFGAGRPVLLVPNQISAEALAGLEKGPALIAWNGSIEATRAVTAGLDLIKAMGKVRVLSIKEGKKDMHPATDLTHFLAWHGIAATVGEAPQDVGKATAEHFLAAAREAGATLVVMGAYSHGRLRQLVLGGVTSHMIDAADIPVLMAH
ncbi:universal stress protein family protein [Dongia mobilis]|uniref:Universal stress protein family protein n=1 Tax=Dongia mobilis TaxID=578943 RepID=A0A4R6WY88_9PROT|nr:universal stress protein [Dongia mobilis]TDQ85473.1 universal stress protein family protein [Dongia mobilis]